MGTSFTWFFEINLHKDFPIRRYPSNPPSNNSKRKKKDYAASVSIWFFQNKRKIASEWNFFFRLKKCPQNIKKKFEPYILGEKNEEINKTEAYFKDKINKNRLVESMNKMFLMQNISHYSH